MSNGVNNLNTIMKYVWNVR